jgi:hypothetical protein
MLSIGVGLKLFVSKIIKQILPRRPLEHTFLQQAIIFEVEVLSLYNIHQIEPIISWTKTFEENGGEGGGEGLILPPFNLFKLYFFLLIFE